MSGSAVKLCEDCGEREAYEWLGGLCSECSEYWDREYWKEEQREQRSLEVAEYRKERKAANAASGGKLRVLDTRRLLTTDPPPLHWLVGGVFATGYLTLFAGREKTGKSLVQLALGACAASGGGAVAGIEVKPAHVLLVDAENGEREQHRRLRSLGLDAKHAENLVCAEASGGFELRRDLPRVVALIEEYAPELVLLDSFRSLWGGNERDDAETEAALGALRDLAHNRNIAVGLTHHATKGNGDSYRGGTGIGAAVDHIVVLSRVGDDENKRRRKLANPMCRFASEQSDLWLQIESSGDNGPVFVLAADAYRPPKPHDEKTEAVLDALNTAAQSEREMAAESGVKRSTVQRILKELAAEGQAKRVTGGWVAQVAQTLGSGPVGHQSEGGS